MGISFSFSKLPNQLVYSNQSDQSILYYTLPVCGLMFNLPFFFVQWAFQSCWLSLFAWWETDALALLTLSFSVFCLSFLLFSFLRCFKFGWLKSNWISSNVDITAHYLLYFCITNSLIFFLNLIFFTKYVSAKLHEVTMPEAECSML